MEPRDALPNDGEDHRILDVITHAQPAPQDALPDRAGPLGHGLTRRVSDRGQDFDPAQSELAESESAHQPGGTSRESTPGSRGTHPVPEVGPSVQAIDPVHAHDPEHGIRLDFSDHEMELLTLAERTCGPSDPFRCIDLAVLGVRPGHPWPKFRERLAYRGVQLARICGAWRTEFDNAIS